LQHSAPLKKEREEDITMGSNFLNNFVTVFSALLDLSTNGKTWADMCFNSLVVG
jgi:hypothetical protein